MLSESRCMSCSNKYIYEPEFGGQRCPLPCPAPVLPRFFWKLTARCPALPRFSKKLSARCPALPRSSKNWLPTALPCPGAEQGQCCPEFRCPDFEYDLEFISFIILIIFCVLITTVFLRILESKSKIVSIKIWVYPSGYGYQGWKNSIFFVFLFCSCSRKIFF